LLLVSAIVLLSFDNTPYLREFPLWLTGLIIGRDVLLAIGSLVVHLVVGKMTVRPRLTGKVATVFQMIAVSWILLRWDFNYGLLKIWLLGAGLFTGVSGLLYLVDWIASSANTRPACRGRNEFTADGV